MTRLDPATVLLRLRRWMPVVSFVLRNLWIRVRGWRQTGDRMALIGVNASLSATVLRANGQVEHLGTISERVITTLGGQWLCDALQGIVAAQDLNWHQSGTTAAAENVGNTALAAVVGVRVSGAQSEASPVVYRSQATLNYVAPATIAEHAIFTAQTGGVLFDRSVFAGVAVLAGDAIQFTYELTINTGT